MSRPKRAIVLAAGEGTRWGNHLGVPKHLIEIDGEPILHRTVRLLKQHVDDVIVMAPLDPRYACHDGRTVPVAPRGLDIDKFYSSVDFWGRDGAGHCLLVYGDCYFTEHAVETMCGDVDTLTLFCRPGASEITGSPWGECWGFSIPKHHVSRFRNHCQRLAGLQALGELPRAGGWELYRSMTGRPLDQHSVAEHAEVIDDETEDFDYPEDYERWMKLVRSSFEETQAGAWTQIREQFAGHVETVNGPGSTLELTAELREHLPIVLANYDIRTMLDAPCGDWNWMRHVDLGDVDYTGWDVEPTLVGENADRFGDFNRVFECVNLLTVDEIPPVDLILCRDFFIHLPNKQICAVLDKFVASGSRYLLTTTFPDAGNDKDCPAAGHDDRPGYWARPVNLCAPPFKFPEPTYVIAEPHRFVALFDLDKLREVLKWPES